MVKSNLQGVLEVSFKIAILTFKHKTIVVEEKIS